MVNALMHVVHAAVLGLVLYALMVYCLKQNRNVAETRSVLIAGLALVYMVVFGHGLPGRVNSHLM